MNAEQQAVEKRPVATHLSGANNSTRFTDCCGLAVLRGDTVCPGKDCGRQVETKGFSA